MKTRLLKIVQYVDRSPSRGVCSLCGREFRTPMSVLHKPDEALTYLTEMFERHSCPDKARTTDK